MIHLEKLTYENFDDVFELKVNLIALGGKGEKKKGYSETDFDFSKVHQETF
jgi:hypothetical protein